VARKKTLWTPERVRERIRVGMLLRKLHDHIEMPEEHPFGITQLKAATFLLSRIVGNATQPQSLNVNGNMTVVFRNPTERPEGMFHVNRRPHLNGSNSLDSKESED
jgi:hypothetical protein